MCTSTTYSQKLELPCDRFPHTTAINFRAEDNFLVSLSFLFYQDNHIEPENSDSNIRQTGEEV